ncbi:MAG TPA: hypothetical protein VKA85_00130 [Candidatus Limnocylindrales bacterium]|nr:hypothetical protein [Candidatus Limnocylindrales bacterium]
MRVTESDRAPVVETSSYRLAVVAGKPVAWLDDAAGERWAELRVLASLDTLEGLDETTAMSGPTIEVGEAECVLTWRLNSTLWRSKTLSLVCREATIDVRVRVEGRGRLTDIELLGGAATMPPAATGHFRSGAWFSTVMSPNPGDPARILTSAMESSTIGVTGGSEPGRGHWFFTPAPFCYAVTHAAAAGTDAPAAAPAAAWLTFGLAATDEALGFTSFDYTAADRGFSFVLSYEGHTPVGGAFDAPPIVIVFGAADAYDAIERHRRELVDRGLAPPAAAPTTPRWWLEPMFCGWGAQCHLARAAGQTLASAASYSREEHYDAFLAALESNGVVPGTVVVDDKWQADYGTGEPDRDKWPDLRGWIARRHDAGQRVLLWWKAWDGGSLPADMWVRTATGSAVALDPDHPGARAAIAQAIDMMLAEDRLGADGLKIDFTARTPSGSSLRHHGPHWGVGLLRELLAVVHDAAKRVKPDALLIGHTPNPAVDPFVDMIRLNDMLRLDDPNPIARIGPQMRHRAAIARAASPNHPIDTDDWCVPDLASWREYTAVKPGLGVPALYYATHVDLTGEPFGPRDYELLRDTWAAHRRTVGLPQRR